MSLENLGFYWYSTTRAIILSEGDPAKGSKRAVFVKPLEVTQKTLDDAENVFATYEDATSFANNSFGLNWYLLDLINEQDLAAAQQAATNQELEPNNQPND